VKILLLTEVFPPRKGGSGRWLWELYRRLPGIETYVVAGEFAGADAFDRDAELPIQRLPIYLSHWGVWNPRGAYEYARVVYKIRRVMSRVRPDVIHCGKCLPEGLIAAVIRRWSGVPFTCYAHGEELTLARTSAELRWLTAKVLREADLVIANSEHTKQLLTRDWKLSEHKIAVMHPGVDTKIFRPAARDMAVRARLGWTDRRVVLTVGALQKRKGQDMLIRALPAIRQQCPDVLFAMAGEGWEQAYLEGLAREVNVLDLVQFRGIPDEAELVECYQQCDLFALPNRQVGWDIEGFGIVLLEAQSCGKAVIAGKSGGTAEAMQADRTGALVECDTPDRLGRVVTELLQDRERAKAMGQHGRAWVVERFDWDALSRTAVELFTRTEEVASSRAS
jgi:phosphatidyl-myo-inositol dimannoside synthase